MGAAKNLIHPRLPSGGVERPWQLSDHGLSEGEKRKARAQAKRDADREVSGWFDAGVRNCEKALCVATSIDVSEGYLSGMRTGRNPIPLRAVLAFKGSRDSAIAFTAGLLGTVDHIAVPARSDVALTHEQVKFLLEMRAALGPAVFDAVVIPRFAVNVFQCEPATLLVALEQHLKLGR